MEDSDGEFLPDYYLLKNSKRKSQLVASSSVGAGVCVIPAFGVESGESGKAEEKHEDHCHSKKMKTGNIGKGKTNTNCCLDCLGWVRKKVELGLLVNLPHMTREMRHCACKPGYRVSF